MRLAVLGTFGAGNLGDEAVFLAFKQNFERAFPVGELFAICSDPGYLEREHGIRGMPLRRAAPRIVQPLQIRRTLPVKIKDRAAETWADAKRTRSFLGEMRTFAQSMDALVILGGGQIFDFWTGAFGHPWNLYAWSRAFRRAGKSVWVPSIGACPLKHQLSKFFIRKTLNTARYVSFRDTETEKIVRGFGFRGKVEVLPDLAFSLRPVADESADATGWIGISPMVYMHPELWPQGNAAQYAGVLDKLAAFAQTLLAKNYRLRIFASQIRSDRHAIEDLLGKFDADGELRKSGRVELPEIRGVPSLLRALASVEIVVATRFHGVLLSLLMEKPAVSVGYQPKNHRLLETFGLHDLVLDIHDFTTADLDRAFAAALGQKNAFQDPGSPMAGKLDEFRNRLKDQYNQIFASMAAQGNR